MSTEKTILVVDDDAKLLLALHKRLTQAGFQVLTAADAGQAMDIARTEHVDAISLDVRLPGELSGLDVAVALHQDARTASIPILFITGSANDDFKHMCRAVGGRFFIAKPYDADLLVQTLRGMLVEDDLAEVRRISTLKRRQPVGEV